MASEMKYLMPGACGFDYCRKVLMRNIKLVLSHRAPGPMYCNFFIYWGLAGDLAETIENELHNEEEH